MLGQSATQARHDFRLLRLVLAKPPRGRSVVREALTIRGSIAMVLEGRPLPRGRGLKQRTLMQPPLPRDLRKTRPRPHRRLRQRHARLI
jgi:hypothetical protein